MKICFLGRCFWPLRSCMRNVWGTLIILRKTLTLFLVYNLPLALWRGWLVWHHQQSGLLPVWRRRLLPVHTLHQKGTQTHISSATLPVCHILMGRIGFHHFYTIYFCFSNKNLFLSHLNYDFCPRWLKGSKVFGSLQAHILQSRELRGWSWIQSQILPVYSSRNPSLLARVLCCDAGDFS